MTNGIRRDVRLLFRVDPFPLESPRGYLCRVAQEHNYIGPLSVVRLAGLPEAALERADGIDQISRVLRLEPEEWRAMCYRHVKGRNRHNQRLFYGERVSADDLNYGCPRLCSACLRERPIWWAIWDLGLVTACPIHRCLLFNQCPACSRKLTWQRLAVHQCRCGLDFRDLAVEPADAHLAAINAAIYRGAGFPPGDAAEIALANCGFPAELLELRLGSLLRLVLFVGSIKEQDRLRRKQQHFAATNLAVAIEIGRAAATMLGDWPRPLRAVLRHMLPPETDNPAVLNFRGIFGNFYRHLFRVLPRNEFEFLHEAFERFVIEDWKGLVRGQHRYFSAAVRGNSRWVTVNEAERITRAAGARIWDLARQGQVDAIFLNVGREGIRTECWIRRESLNQWIGARDAKLAPYMARPEAKAALGLTNCTIVTVAAAGAIRYVKGPDQDFPERCFYFLREDVMHIKDAFERHLIPIRAYSKPGEFIALRHAVKNYLGHGAGLAAVIRAVVDGSLLPAGSTTRFRGITGYLFRSEDLRKYRPAPDVTAPPEGFLNYREAAALLGVRTAFIRGLADQGLLTASDFRNGLARLVPAKGVQQFAEQYVATSILAKRFHLNSGSLGRYLRESGTPLLAIPLAEAGRGHAFFLRKDVVAQIQIPSPRLLREQAHRRIVTARKKKWEEYRQAKETALGKPMRRVRSDWRDKQPSRNAARVSA